VCGAEQFEVVVELALQACVQRPHAQLRRQLDDPHRTRRSHQRQIELVNGRRRGVVSASPFAPPASPSVSRWTSAGRDGAAGTAVTSTRCPRSA